MIDSNLSQEFKTLPLSHEYIYSRISSTTPTYIDATVDKPLLLTIGTQGTQALVWKDNIGNGESACRVVIKNGKTGEISTTPYDINEGGSRVFHRIDVPQNNGRDNSVSNNHFFIRSDGSGNYFLQDLDSDSGTFVIVEANPIQSPEQSLKNTEVGFFTSRGVRDHNEDCFSVISQNDFVVAVVADGAGGAEAGEEASNRVVTVFNKLISKLDISMLSNSQIITLLRKVDDKFGMVADKNGKSTATIALVDQNTGEYIVVNCGDSPAIDIDKNGQCKLISSCEKKVRPGDPKKRLDPEQMLGGPHAELDVKIHRGKLEPGHSIIVATDGGNDAFGKDGTNILDAVNMKSGSTFSSSDVANIINNNSSSEAAKKFVKLAKDSGSPDNITTVIIKRN